MLADTFYFLMVIYKLITFSMPHLSQCYYILVHKLESTSRPNCEYGIPHLPEGYLPRPPVDA